jgi:hypothetical protein
MNRYWTRMQKYRPGLFYYLKFGRSGFGHSKANQHAIEARNSSTNIKLLWQKN